MKPTYGVAQVLLEGSRSPAFVGSCFSLWHPNFFVTAAHCLRNAEPKKLLINNPYEGADPRRVEEVTKHSHADLAVLRVADGGSVTEPFQRVVLIDALGLDYYAFGYPEDVFGQDTRQPVPRSFTGYFQRFFAYQSRLGYTYQAGEMNIACPGGLSGGPVFSTYNVSSGVVYGVVTENLQSFTTLDTIEEIELGGNRSRLTYREVINYGICLMLGAYEDWLRGHIPGLSTLPQSSP